MIKAIANHDDGRKFIVLGLSRENMRRLLDGDPIEIDWSAVGVDDQPNIIILGGETEADIVRVLETYGAITGETEIRGHHNAIDMTPGRRGGQPL
jgi:hypothetical protein